MQLTDFARDILKSYTNIECLLQILLISVSTQITIVYTGTIW